MSKTKIDNVYTASYGKVKSDYRRILLNTGEEVEYFGFYRVDEHILSNAPEHSETIEKIITLLKDTGISKITITMLNQNLPPQKI